MAIEQGTLAAKGLQVRHQERVELRATLKKSWPAVHLQIPDDLVAFLTQRLKQKVLTMVEEGKVQCQQTIKLTDPALRTIADVDDYEVEQYQSWMCFQYLGDHLYRLSSSLKGWLGKWLKEEDNWQFQVELTWTKEAFSEHEPLPELVVKLVFTQTPYLNTNNT